jgi:opacity protein-like surface antigen
MMKKTIAIVSIATLFSAQAFAQSGFYAGIDVGQARISPSSGERIITLNDGSPANQTFTSSSQKMSTRFFLGYRLNENIGFEAGNLNTQSFSYSGNIFIAAPNLNLAQSGSFKVSAFDLSVNLRPSKSTGFNNLYLRLGMHNSSLKGTINTPRAPAGQRITRINDSGNGSLIGVGYDFPINEQINLRLDSTRYSKISGNSSRKSTVNSAGLVYNF